MTCRYCGVSYRLQPWFLRKTKDHILPSSRFKSVPYTFNNVTEACNGCNSDKANHTLAEWWVRLVFMGDNRINRVWLFMEKLPVELLGEYCGAPDALEPQWHPRSTSDRRKTSADRNEQSRQHVTAICPVPAAIWLYWKQNLRDDKVNPSRRVDAELR